MLCTYSKSDCGEWFEKIDASIVKVHEAMRYMKSSPNRNQILRSFVEKLGIESKSLLCLDVPTRWNSTYLMLETDKNFEKVFILDFEDDNYLVLISKIIGHLWVFLKTFL